MDKVVEIVSQRIEGVVEAPIRYWWNDVQRSWRILRFVCTEEDPAKLAAYVGNRPVFFTPTRVMYLLLATFPAFFVFQWYKNVRNLFLVTRT